MPASCPARAARSSGWRLPSSGGPQLHRPHLRVPDERARLRAHLRPARGRGLRACHAGDDADVVVFNTCAVRENADNRLYGNLGHLRPVEGRPPGHADRGRRLPRPEGPRRDRPPGAVGGRRLRHPQRGRAAGAAGARPAQRRRAGGDRRSRSRSSRPRCPPAASRPTPAGCRSRWAATTPARSASCRRCAAPSATGVPATSSPRCAALVGRGRAGGDAARPERQRLRGRVRRPRRVRRSCCAPAGEIDGLERVRFTSPHPRDFTDDVIAAMAETPNVCHSAAHAAAVRLGRRAAPDAPLVPVGALPRRSSTRCARRCPTRRSPPTSSSASPARPRPTSPPTLDVVRAARFAERVHVPVLAAARHAGRDDGRPGAQGRRAGALRAADRRCRRRSPGRRTARWSGRVVEVLVAAGEGRKDGGHAAAVRPGPRRSAGALRRRGDRRSGRATSCEVAVTYAAPHHLVADGAAGRAPAHPGRGRRGPAARHRARGWACPASARPRVAVSVAASVDGGIAG